MTHETLRWGALSFVEDLGILDYVGVRGRVSRQRIWRMLCDCGANRDIPARHVKGGYSTNCGCRINSAVQGSPREVTTDSLRKFLDYDADSGIFTRRIAVAGNSIGSVAGRPSPNGYVQVSLGGRGYYAHRLAWLYIYGVWPTKNIDHIDGNPTNNKIANLRQCDQSENNANARVRGNTASGQKGVTFANGKWKAAITVRGKHLILGRFTAIEEAKAAYDAAAATHFGQFARSA